MISLQLQAPLPMVLMPVSMSMSLMLMPITRITDTTACSAAHPDNVRARTLTTR